MRYSKLFGKTSKTISSDEDSINAKFLIQAGYISKQMAGVYNYLPLGLRVLGKIQNIIREEMNAVGGNEILMPTLTQEENYKTTGRDNMDILFRTIGPGEATYFLNPTHEEIVTPLVKKYVFSYQDLPQAVYQIQNKFRNEPRAKSGILRGREFNMKDLYSFHTNEADLDTYYEKVKQAYFKVYERLGLGEKTVLTFASGGVFSKYSHEFQTLCASGEDTVYLCSKCHVAINKEIIEEQKSCPECGNTDLQEEKGIEVGNIFKLRTRFSEPFGFTYADKDGKEHLVEMGCYGMGPSRIMGTLVEVAHDDKGIIWPENVAPFKYQLVVLGNDETVRSTADELYNSLIEKGAEVLYDDREGPTAGEKFADADLIGIPNRLVISKKTVAEESLEYKKRNEEGAKLIKISEFLSTLDKV
ncbi:MAG TPA: aminoacyl--tRNA ligase-related protein [Patescibacteria group bacterium]|nr:aminoacyl--tRNA ligase-related protein [Patescibacteria group bacterium]